MKEIITLSVGQAGLQMGSHCWELFCLEHGIQPDGQVHKTDSQDKRSSNSSSNCFETLFSRTSSERFIPRCLNIDLDETALDEIRTGTYRQILNCHISGKEDAAGNYARGYYTLGKEIVDQCMDRIRTLADDCDDLQGFFVLSSIGGGTGSGLGSLLLERLSADYAKKTKVSLSVFPSSELSIAVTEPYNSVLALHKLLEHTDVSVVFDNNALYSSCIRNIDIVKPTFANINRLIAQVVSSLTTPLRFDQTHPSTLAELHSNFVFYPRFKFLLSSYSPITSTESPYADDTSTFEISKNIFNPWNMMAKCDPNGGKYTACQIMYRGDVIPKDVCFLNENAQSKHTIRFADWCPGYFKVRLSPSLPKFIPGGDLRRVIRAVAMLCNNTSIVEVIERLDKEFDRMHSKRAFVHWYEKEGIDEGEFREAREDLRLLEHDYAEAEDSKLTA